jgi:uncharacterized metal-binding protein YceD (DUF177 family)
MSLGWSRRAPVDTLVGTEAAIDFTIPLPSCPGFRMSCRHRWEAKATVRFSRQVGQAVADLEVSAQPEVVCQRLHAAHALAGGGEVAHRARQRLQRGGRVPEGLEVFLVEADSVSVRDLVDEEILLALPHVARHEEGSECADSEMKLPGQEDDAEEAGRSRRFRNRLHSWANC